MFAAVVILVLAVALLAPSCTVLFLFNRMTFGRALKAAWRVWIAQIIASILLVVLADRLGLLNPAGYTLAICVLVGFAGAFFLRSKSNSRASASDQKPR
ncbi:hypothetical protein [Bradyrhizobium sp. CCH5-F6]|jgi:hypothetical protein|uniref:hypothetical protein n=1 Tax=Bradyrhizobium sp. CCH5-F6 TaxID=1768753 RepID=UPI0012E3F0F5|nr:hypothetical protein [Bradyrhizobium sp. CCH5-F6]